MLTGSRSMAKRPLLRPGWPPLFHQFRRLGAPRPATTAGVSASWTTTARDTSSRSWTTPIQTGSRRRGTVRSCGSNCTRARMIWRRPDGGKTVIHTFAAEHIPDGFKIDIDGNFWVATVTSCGIDIVSHAGAAIDFLELDAVPLNCLFVGTRSRGGLRPSRDHRRNSVGRSPVARRRRRSWHGDLQWRHPIGVGFGDPLHPPGREARLAKVRCGRRGKRPCTGWTRYARKSIG